MCGYPCLRALARRCQDIEPIVVLTGEQPICRLRLHPAVAGPGNARWRPLRQTLQQEDRTLPAALVAQIDPLKFLICPAPVASGSDSNAACYGIYLKLCVTGCV